MSVDRIRAGTTYKPLPPRAGRELRVGNIKRVHDVPGATEDDGEPGTQADHGPHPQAEDPQGGHAGGIIDERI